MFDRKRSDGAVRTASIVNPHPGSPYGRGLPLLVAFLAYALFVTPSRAQSVEEFYRGKTINGLIVRRDGELLFVAYDGQV